MFTLFHASTPPLMLSLSELISLGPEMRAEVLIKNYLYTLLNGRFELAKFTSEVEASRFGPKSNSVCNRVTKLTEDKSALSIHIVI